MQHPSAGNRPDGDAFWRFSLTLYARPGVADALIAMQDRAGRNVNLILFALWLGAVRGYNLDRAELNAAEAASAPIDSAVVAPLRRLRRDLKSCSANDTQALRRRIAALEIDGERRMQHRLAAGLPVAARQLPVVSRLAAAQANLALYLAEYAASAEAGVVRRALAALLRSE